MNEINEAIHWLIVAAGTYGMTAPTTMAAERALKLTIKTALAMEATERAVLALDACEGWEKTGGEG